jgi:hypothetical protein
MSKKLNIAAKVTPKIESALPEMVVPIDIIEDVVLKNALITIDILRDFSYCSHCGGTRD